ncbi:signal peptidase II [Jannaschia ovalis]|uniref:Lipoprotein signal peptidase n=1 Tax=Jannaschia ovalis TaxID=3038773 RepID=A0ABY8LI73_9RHOB|nr:signal peptidase II [Jannaschia sp. GRR-S6-38]WGH79813.1 signal peptidase II [Jannaschia sp. GRR-S6-38]
MRRILTWAALAFAIDQLSKVIVVHAMNLKTVGVIEVLPPLLTFRMGWNEGVNFGLMSGAGARWLLVAVAIGVSGLLLRWARGFARPVGQIAAGLVIGGALANALDRVIYGAVADFLNMSCCGIRNPYAFNIADVFIFAGAFGLIVWADDPKKQQAGKADGKTP